MFKKNLEKEVTGYEYLLGKVFAFVAEKWREQLANKSEFCNGSGFRAGFVEKLSGFGRFDFVKISTKLDLTTSIEIIFHGFFGEKPVLKFFYKNGWKDCEVIYFRRGSWEKKLLQCIENSENVFGELSAKIATKKKNRRLLERAKELRGRI